MCQKVIEIMKNRINIGRLYKTEQNGLTRINSDIEMKFDKEEISRTFFMKLKIDGRPI